MASDGEISCTNDPNFAVIYSFLKVFGKLYGLDIPTLTKLQELVENTQEVLEPLKELHLRLLRRALKSVQSNRWERGLIKFCHQQGHHQEAWEVERFSYKKASTTVKLKVLKLLLEYQFTCHPKFKNLVNAESCKDLRLEPIGRDKSGCVYWLQVDHEANLCLYREDQDEETWQLIARNREELVKVIGQLKSGEEICPSTVNNNNEDSNSFDAPTQDEAIKTDQEVDNEEEEFLSPESESEHDDEEPKSKDLVETEIKDNIQKNQEEKEKILPSNETATQKVDEQREIEEDPPSPKRKRSESPSKVVTESIEKEKSEVSENFKQNSKNLSSLDKGCCDQLDHPLVPNIESGNPIAENDSAREDFQDLDNSKSKSGSPVKDLETVNQKPASSEVSETLNENATKTLKPEIVDSLTSSVNKPDALKESSETCYHKLVSSEQECDSSKGNIENEYTNKHETPKEMDNPIHLPDGAGYNTEDSEENPNLLENQHNSSKKIDSHNIEDALKDSPTKTGNEESDEKVIEDEEQNFKDEVGEAIEDPVMIVKGEGNGADCESFFLGEEISEPIMYFYGEGCGYDNDTGNPEVVEHDNDVKNESGEENGDQERVNGESYEIVHCKLRSSRNVKFLNKTPPVNKRTLKKQAADTSEALKPDTKKHCIRDMEKSESSNSVDRDLKRESSVNEKTTDSESPSKNNVKKSRNKVKKKVQVTRKQSKEKLNSVIEADNGQDSKTSIIEKRKSSLSSEEQDKRDHSENEKEKTSDKDLKIEDSLPLKKIRLETTPESEDPAPHSKHIVDTVDDSHNSESKNQSDDNVDENNVENVPVPKRKKIKARKGKFKRKKVPIKVDNDAEKSDANDKDSDNEVSKVAKNKSLKRSLLDATVSDNNKSESQSESDEDEPANSGKRLKIKPKKLNKSLRKSIQPKVDLKQTSDESEEETLYSLAGKKSSIEKKKVLKKKPKSKEVKKQTAKSESDNETPVRQSRRIAQLKIREEAERRHQEDLALRELKMIHKKKTNKDDEDEEEWQASGKSSSDSEKPSRSTKKKDEWRAADSTDNEASDSDEPLFDHHEHHEPDLDFSKSDHEFSPESDLESGEPAEPLKRARTLQEQEKESGFCQRCGSGEQPEWILLCDRCDGGYHASCLKPLLFLIPEGDWFCPGCSHEMLIENLEKELIKYDELFVVVEAERERKRLEQPPPASHRADGKGKEDKSSGEEGSSDWSSSSSEGAVYRLRARKQLPVSYRAREYDRLISSAIKEEYVEPTTSAGNQGRGKDISTIIEAAEEEKLKAEREAIEQGKPVEKKKKKQRRKPRKLNSLDVPSEDDDETDEDFKDTGLETSSEDISSSAERASSSRSASSDDLPIRRACRPHDKKERSKMTESSPEVKKKKKGVLDDSSSESGENKEWNKKKKSKPKHRKRDKSSMKKSRKRRGLTQYDADGNVIRARVTYGGLSGDDGENDWSPKHRTRQKKINYTEMPNTESEDEMHKSSGKHMPDSSDEFHITESDLSSDTDGERKRKREDETEERRKALEELIKKTAVVPLEKLPEDVTKAKTEELNAHLEAQAQAQAEADARPARGRGGRGRGSRGGRGRGGGGGGRGRAGDAALASLVGVKIKDLGPDGAVRPLDAEREKKRQEREAKLAEKEARRMERQQKKEEKEKMKEQKAKEREEKRLARLAQQETKRLKKEKPEFSPVGGAAGFGAEPLRAAFPPHLQYAGPRGPPQPRLQVRAELRGALTGDRGAMREGAGAGAGAGTLSVAGSPQPFRPPGDEPSVITRMPHVYQGSMVYGGAGGAFGARGGSGFMQHPALRAPQPPHQYPPQYYAHVRGLPPGYPPGALHQRHPPPGHPQGPPGHGPQGPPGHGPQGPPGHGPPGTPGLAPPGHGHQSPLGHGPPGPPGHGPPGHGPPGHLPPGTPGHGPPGTPGHRPPSHGPPGTPGHGPPNHGPPGPPGPGQMGPHGPHGPYGPLRQSPGPQGPHHRPGHPQTMAGHPPGMPPRPHLIGPQGHPGPPVSRSLPNHPGLQSLQSQPRLSSTVTHSSPHTVSSLGQSPNPHAMPLFASHLLRNTTPHSLPQRIPVSHPSPNTTPPRNSVPHPGIPGLRPSVSPPPTSPNQNEPVKIKAEVKTEPEYQSPTTSPRPSSPRDDTPRHPKIKHTENKERRPRFPLGPYAPQYGAYGPYAPPGPIQQPPRLHAPYLPNPERPNMERPPHDPQYLAHLQRMRAPFPPMNYPPNPRNLPPGLQYHQQYSEPPRSALEKQLSTPGSIPQQMPPNSSQQHMPPVSLHQQMPPNSSQQHMPPVSLHQQMPPNSSQQHMPPVSLHQQMPPNSSQQHMPPVSLHQQMPPNSSQQHMPPVSLHQQMPPNPSQHMPPVSIHQQMPPVSLHQQMPPSSSQQHMPPVSVHQQMPPNSSQHMPPVSVHQQMPPVSIPHQMPPNSIAHQMPQNPSQQHLPPVSRHQQMPPEQHIPQNLRQQQMPPVSLHQQMPPEQHMPPNSRQQPMTQEQHMPPNSRQPMPPVSIQQHMQPDQHMRPNSRQDQMPPEQHMISNSRQQHMPPNSRQEHMPPVSIPQHTPVSLAQQMSTPVSIPHHRPQEPEVPRMATPDRPPSLPKAPERVETPSVSDNDNIPPRPPEADGNIQNGAPIKLEIKEEIRDAPIREESSGVFGGLVSYFSSQREDDIDA